MNIQYLETGEAGRTVEITPTDERDEVKIPFEVGNDAAVFALGVGFLVEGDLPPATEFSVALLRDGKLVTEEDKNATFHNDSLVAYVEENPPPGRWEIQVWQNTKRPFLVSAGFLKRGFVDILGRIPADRCKICKNSLSPLIFALLAKLTGGAVVALHGGAFAAMPAHILSAFLAGLHNLTGIPIGWLTKLFSSLPKVFGIETPWGYLARRICEKLGACPVAGP